MGGKGSESQQTIEVGRIEDLPMNDVALHVVGEMMLLVVTGKLLILFSDLTS